MDERRRVLIPQALGSDEFLGVTWHEGRRVIVFSHWEGDRCTAATPVRASDLGEVAELVVSAFTRSVDPSWPAPHPAHLVAFDPPSMTA